MKLKKTKPKETLNEILNETVKKPLKETLNALNETLKKPYMKA